MLIPMRGTARVVRVVRAIKTARLPDWYECTWHYRNGVLSRADDQPAIEFVRKGATLLCYNRGRVPGVPLQWPLTEIPLYAKVKVNERYYTTHVWVSEGRICRAGGRAPVEFKRCAGDVHCITCGRGVVGKIWCDPEGMPHRDSLDPTGRRLPAAVMYHYQAMYDHGMLIREISPGEWFEDWVEGWDVL